MNLALEIDFPGSGTLALVGAGEYLPLMEPVDRHLLGRLDGPADVICLPTAAGTEGLQRNAYWSELGVMHFRGLGAQAEALQVIDRESAMNPAYAQRINQANFVYLSGGKPSYLHATLQGTPVWEAILGVLERGGVVAGCSAGAMIFGEHIPTSLFSSHWQTAFGLVRGAYIIPHFNELPALVLRGLPLLAIKHVLVGIDAGTALVCSRDGLSVQGSGGVTLGLGNDRQRFTQIKGGL